MMYYSNTVFPNPSTKALAREVTSKIKRIPKMSERQFESFLEKVDLLIKKLLYVPEFVGIKKNLKLNREAHRKYFLTYIDMKYPTFRTLAIFPKVTAGERLLIEEERKYVIDDEFLHRWQVTVISIMGRYPDVREKMGSLRALVYNKEKEVILNFN